MHCREFISEKVECSCQSENIIRSAIPVGAGTIKKLADLVWGSASLRVLADSSQSE
jgi:hypothetical protein